MNFCKKYLLILLFSISGFRADITTEQFLAVPEIRDLWNEIKKRTLIFRDVDLEITSYSSYTPPEAKDFDRWSCWLQAPLAPIIHERTAGILPLNQTEVMKVFGTRDLPGLAGDGTGDLFVPEPQGTFFDLFDQSFWSVLTQMLQEKIRAKKEFSAFAVLLYFVACSAKQSDEKQSRINELLARNAFLNMVLVAARNFSVFGLPPAFIFSNSGDSESSSLNPPLCFSPKASLCAMSDIEAFLNFLEKQTVAVNPVEILNLLQLFSVETFFSPIILILDQDLIGEDGLGCRHLVGVRVEFDQRAKTLEIFIFDSGNLTENTSIPRWMILPVKDLLVTIEIIYATLSCNRTSILTKEKISQALAKNQPKLKENLKLQLRYFFQMFGLEPDVSENGKFTLRQAD